MKINAIAFDLDDTLCDYSRAKDDALVGIAAALFADSADQEALLDSYHSNEPRLFREFLDKTISIDEYRIQRFLLPLQKFSSSSDDSVWVTAERMNYEYMRLCNEEVPIFSDARPALQEMVDLGIPLVLVTNGPSDGQRTKIKQLNIESFFTAILVSSEVGVAKPATEIFSLAANAANVDLANLLMVGDSIRDDYHGALGAGCQAILLDRKSSTMDETIQTLSSLEDLGLKVGRGDN